MRLPGRSRAPISIRSGTPTAAAITSQITASASVSGTSSALESLETSFHQDLNGDGVIGRSTTVIEAIRIDQPGRGWDQLFPLCTAAGSSGPDAEICRRGCMWRVNLASGRRSARSRRQPGIEVAWKVTGADQYYGLEHRQQRQLHLKQWRRRARRRGYQFCVGIARTQFPPGLEQRRADRNGHRFQPGVPLRPPLP